MAIAERAPHTAQAGLEIPLKQEAYRVLNPFEFIRDFQNEAQLAQKRVWAKAMVVEQAHAPGLILNSIYNAAMRGVDAKVVLDKHSEKVGGNGSSLQSVLNQNKLIDLISGGVKIEHANHPKGLMTKIPILGKYSGRDHIKIYIVDNTAWLGGVNLEHSNFNNIDFMVKIKKSATVEKLASLMQDNFHNKDYETVLDDETRLIIDAGIPGKSRILDEAVGLVNSAKTSVQNFSMLLPDGKFLEALKKAKKRGVRVEVATSSAKEHGVLLSKAVQTASGIRYSALHQRDLPVRETRRFVHAKYLEVDEKVAMFGSHNLSGQGVFLGTEEIAMVTTNPQLISDLSRFFKEEYV